MENPMKSMNKICMSILMLGAAAIAVPAMAQEANTNASAAQSAQAPTPSDNAQAAGATNQSSQANAAADASTSPGQALASSGFSSENRPIRINRLLRAEGDAFEGLFLSACRFLASKAQPVDWRSMSFLALRQGDTERKQLAREFYSPKKAAVPAAT